LRPAGFGRGLLLDEPFDDRRADAGGIRLDDRTLLVERDAFALLRIRDTDVSE
jgi:hypothetical protein